jgi:hypothetical protein
MAPLRDRHNCQIFSENAVLIFSKWIIVEQVQGWFGHAVLMVVQYQDEFFQ